MKKKELKAKANELRQRMFVGAQAELAMEINNLPDEALVKSVSQHVKIKVRLF